MKLKVYHARLQGGYEGDGFVLVAAQDRAEAWTLVQLVLDTYATCLAADVEEAVGVFAEGQPRIIKYQPFWQSK